MTDFGINVFKSYINDTRIGINRDPYFSNRLSIDKDWKNEFEIFKEDASKFNNLLCFRKHLNEVELSAIHQLGKDNLIRDTIRNNETAPDKVENSYFSTEYDGERFIIIDQKNAIFRIFSEMYPQLFHYSRSWEEFFSHYTDVKSVYIGKRFRTQILNSIYLPYDSFLFLKKFNQPLVDKIKKELGYDIFNAYSDEISIKLKPNQEFQEVKNNLKQIVDTDKYHISYFTLQTLWLPKIFGNQPIFKYGKDDKTFFKGPDSCTCDNYHNYYHIIYKTYFNIPITEDDWIIK